MKRREKWIQQTIIPRNTTWRWTKDRRNAQRNTTQKKREIPQIIKKIIVTTSTKLSKLKKEQQAIRNKQKLAEIAL